ncbi:MAG TPA: hypothetical protein VHE36_06490, partial [Sphingomicrobium sp.]|nr:hypothetical protein [Sphingomicrobium sp.]
MISSARPAYRSIRKKLLISCASVAIATAAVTPQKLRAQSAGAFQGTPSTVSGTVDYSRGAGTETITVSSPTATINWSPYDNETATANPIDFLPKDNVATFTSSSGVLDYTVLNRIVPLDPSRAIELNGTVLSTLQGTSQTGGRIWFYSPGGILIGSTAVFDVGSLLLTTADPGSWDPTSGGFTGSFGEGGEVNPASPGSKIQIAAGAQLKALEKDSYITLIAPRIEQGGTVLVNGSAAYMAGEAMTMTFSQGLFDVQVDVGTDDPNGIVHTGTTGGPANQVVADNHRIYMAAVPKNQALTMLLGGNVGFDEAVSADVENGQIKLSAGWSPFVDGTNEGYQTFDTQSFAALTITGGNFTSFVDALANSDVNARTIDGPLSFTGDVNLSSFNGSVFLSAFEGQTLSVGGNAFLSANGKNGGQATMSATSGGKIDIVGTAFLYAAAAGDIGDAYATDTFGGSINVEADGGDISTGSLILNANAVGLDGNSDFAAGNGYGGTIDIWADSGGSITTGSLSASADGRGGNMLNPSTLGGNGWGGSIYMWVGDGSITAGTADFSASGYGGSWDGTGSPTIAQGGEGFGGYISLYNYGPGSITFSGTTNLIADGIGGDGQSGGAGHGGSADITVYDGTMALGPSTYMSASGWGGSATVGFGGAGGDATGGAASIDILSDPGNFEVPATSGTLTGGDVIVAATATGGTGGAGNGDNIAAGAGGNAEGGVGCGECGTSAATIMVDGTATLALASVTVNANAIGGEGGAGLGGQAGGAGGSAVGGFASVIYSDNAAAGTGSGSMSFEDLYVGARGTGGAGGSSDTGTAGDGGMGTGGFALLEGLAGTLEVTGSNLTIDASGWGGDGGNGGEGDGGFAWGLFDGSLDAQFVNFDASGTGGEGSSGNGGTGSGGFAQLQIEGGTITGGGVSVTASGYGGSGLVRGGDGEGGSAIVAFSTSEAASFGGALDLTDFVVVNASGVGGTGLINPAGAGGAGGDGYGGAAQFFTTDFLQPNATISVDVGGISVGANGNGGSGGNGVTGGDGGLGFGGSALTSLYGGTISAPSISSNAAGSGGAGGAGSDGVGGTGGAGTGGYAEVDIGTVVAGDVTSFAWAFGGQGGAGTIVGNGGAAQGGTAYLNIFTDGELDGAANLNTWGVGGAGGNGGEGRGGDAEVLVQGSLLAPVVSINGGGSGGIGSTGNGGYSAGGIANLLIDGGSVDVTGDLFVGANANIDFNNDQILDGGAGAVNGGDSDGGSAKIQILSTGGSLTVGGNTSVVARGPGGAGGPDGDGSGGHGGAGRGGDASFIVDTACSTECAASVDVQDLFVNANGFGGLGGNSTVGGRGGDGFGGTTNIEINSGTFTARDIGENAQGTGGNGGTGSDGLGGDGGTGEGGVSHLTVSGDLQAASYGGHAHGTGGNGGTGTSGAGDGGNGFGGQIYSDILSGGSVDIVGGGDPSFAGIFIISAAGIGGNGFNGGNGSGGQSELNVDGSLNVSGLLQVSGRSFGGTGSGGNGGDANGSEGSGTLNISGSVEAARIFVAADATGGNGSVNGGSATGGSANVNVDGGTLDLTDFGSQVDTDATSGTAGTGTTGSATAGNSSAAAFNGGNITALSLIVDAVGDVGTGSVRISAGSDCDCALGSINATDLSLFSSNTINVPLIGTDITVSGRLSVESDLDIIFSDVTAGTFAFDAGGDVTGNDIIVADHVDGSADGAVTLGNITVGPGLPANPDDFSVGITAGTSITVGDVSGAGNVGFATLGSLTTGDISAGDLFMALVGGDVSLGSVTTSALGEVYIGDVSMFFDAGGPDNFDASLVLAQNPVMTGGSITINGSVDTGIMQGAAGSDFTVHDVTASQSVDLTAGNLADFEGTVSAPTITVTSGDINVASGASLGVLGVTDLLTLNAVSDQSVIIGESGITPAPGQYELNEAGEIEAANLVFNAFGVDGGTAPDIEIYDGVLEGSLTPGGGLASVTVNTSSSILVLGSVEYLDAAASDVLSLNAGERIEVITDAGGSITMTDATGDPSGTLNLTAHDIWVADQAVIDQLEIDPNYAGRDTDLATNSGTENDAGYLVAGGIAVDLLGSSFLVQNTGNNSDTLAGLTVGDGGLTIVNEGTEPATVIAFGRAVSDGVVTGGEEFAALVQPSGTFTTDSTVNNCPLGGCSTPTPTPTP